MTKNFTRSASNDNHCRNSDSSFYVDVHQTSWTPDAAVSNADRLFSDSVLYANSVASLNEYSVLMLSRCCDNHASRKPSSHFNPTNYECDTTAGSLQQLTFTPIYHKVGVTAPFLQSFHQYFPNQLFNPSNSSTRTPRKQTLPLVLRHRKLFCPVILSSRNSRHPAVSTDRDRTVLEPHWLREKTRPNGTTDEMRLTRCQLPAGHRADFTRCTSLAA